MSGSNSSVPGASPHAAPEPVSFTVHSVALPASDDAERRTRTGRLKMLLVMLVCAAPVIASYLTYFVIRPEGRTNYGSLIDPPRPPPASLRLQALDGRAMSAATLRGQWLLVAVGPSSCDAGCEKRLYLQRQLREMLGRERDRLDKLWLITDAGEPDATLRQALEATPAMWMLKTDAAQLQGWLVPEAGHRIDEHFYIVDPHGAWMMRMPVGAEPARIKRDLERLLRASASWDQPGR